MISFEREGNRFRIKLSGDRQRMYANDVPEMQQAVAHYYGYFSDVTCTQSDACPLCRAGAEATKKLNEKTR